ncbi:hypothetical protein HMPREF0623_0146 [Pediococcus acidilactici DSM 20284]|uniref:Uncharacterized protein n=1 Tax=Pediococcus acidilactici DSM 20284 TaxID=862514 RepID=E0NET4_PEDAC|nr:hypothetical protein HMPREF0623_0146 [Pediococcus acidilactici DSM 20284]
MAHATRFFWIFNIHSTFFSPATSKLQGEKRWPLLFLNVY